MHLVCYISPRLTVRGMRYCGKYSNQPCLVMCVIDIAWQSVPYGLYSTKLEGRSPEGEGCMPCDSHAICIKHPKDGAYVHCQVATDDAL